MFMLFVDVLMGAVDVSRRQWFVRASIVCAGVLPTEVLAMTRRNGQEPEEEEVSPPEDLMREHGVLKRVLLVYDEAIRRIDAKQDLPPDAVHNSAQVIRSLIEDYHE